MSSSCDSIYTGIVTIPVGEANFVQKKDENNHFDRININTETKKIQPFNSDDNKSIWNVIWKEEELNNMRTDLGTNYILGANITLTEATYNEDNPNSGWEPIGGDYDNVFQGNFDGNGFDIKDLYINTTEDYAGLFGYAENATITNVSLINVNITGNSAVGGLVGYASMAVITNSYYDKDTTGKYSENQTKGIGKSTAEMKQQTTYSGWDFNSIWKIQTGQYPKLSWQ